MPRSFASFETAPVPAEGDLAETLAGVPAAAGVAQLVGRDGRNLLIGMPAHLRRWAGAQLGLSPPPRKGARPRTNLRPVAGALRYAPTRSGFEQRLVYERLMAEHVAIAARRDLDTPAYLRLDPGERFPRIGVSVRAGAPATLFGPLRHRRAAAAARDALHRRYPLRPCEYAFEPDPGLPLGKGCVYAQLRSCAAPCLARVSEEAYRGLAAQAAALLLRPSLREAACDAWLPPWVSSADALALVVERVGPQLQLFPVRAAAVLDAEACLASDTELEAALGRLRFEPRQAARDDAPWLVAWLRAKHRRGCYLVLEDSLSGSSSALSNTVRSALARAARGSPAAS